MFGSLGFPEIAFILILALLLFGPRRLPEIGRTVGKSLAEFRRASNDLRRTLENEVALEEPDKKAATPTVRPTAAPVVPRGARELAAPKEGAERDDAEAPPKEPEVASAAKDASSAAPAAEPPAADAQPAEPPRTD